MPFLFRPDNHFNLANLFTIINITCGLIAVYFISQNHFFTAIIFAWIGGAFDIIDGKIARKFGLSNAFGVQLDSFADFLSFVLVPVFLLFQAVYAAHDGITLLLGAAVSIYYVISGLRRLIQFNLSAEAGTVEHYFTGVPTPLGAILLWLVYLTNAYGLTGALFVMPATAVIGWLLNSDVKVPHP